MLFRKDSKSVDKKRDLVMRSLYVLLVLLSITPYVIGIELVVILEKLIGEYGELWTKIFS